MDEKDTASRKWQLTFNTPEEHGWTHDKIREVLRSFKTMAYWCMADEIGAEEKTPHSGNHHHRRGHHHKQLHNLLLGRRFRLRKSPLRP